MTIAGDYYYHPPHSYEMEVLDCPPIVKEIVSRSLTKWRYNTFTERELREQDRRKTPIDGIQKRHRTRIETIRSYMLGCMPAWSHYIQRYPVLDFIDYTLRGSGQVIFCNNSITGLFILISLFIGDPWIACCSLCGLLSATIMALFLNFNKGAIRAGLFGFNGVLVGAALGTFLANGSWSGTTIAAIIVMGMFSTILTAAIANFNGTFKLPTFTLPFNLCAIVFMLGVYQFYHFEMIPGISGSIALAHDVSPIQSYLSSDLIVAVFKGVSQVWLINNTASGVLIIVGMAFCSPLSSFFAFLGSSIGLIVGLSLGVNVQDAMIGLWGYNAVLSCVALGGVFYILCIKQFVLCVFGGILCTILLGTFKGLFATLGMPAFTFPFCLGTIVFILIQNSLPDVIALPLPSITTPEQHLKLKKIVERAIQRMKNNANIKRERKTQEINIIIITDKEIETPASGIKEKTTSPLDLPVVAMAP